ncbi:MAG: SDR family NAD(P)-dependent oxidoreductase, partial [Mesorhizobium sp.]
MKPDFHGKVAIVTGAGSGIGAAVSRQLAQEGAEIVVADLDAEAAHCTAAEISSQGGRAYDFAVDVTDAAAVEKLIEFTVQKCGGLDMAVNNAGIDGIRKATADYPLDNWHKLIN